MADQRSDGRAPSSLGLGTAVFSREYASYVDGPYVSPTVLLAESVRRGIRYIDTALGYGESEVVLGQVADLLDASHVRICTKLPAAALDDGLEISLRRLRRKRVDTLLVHSATLADLADPRVADALRAAKAAGHASRTGVSTYGAEAAQRALDQPWCDVVQVEHSIVNPSVVRRLVEGKGFHQEIVVRSVLCKGLLTSRRRRLHLSDRAAAVTDRLDSLARSWGWSLPELAIRFALDTPGVDVVLVGIFTRTELQTAVAALDRDPLASWQMDILAEYDCSDEDWTHPERWAPA